MSQTEWNWYGMNLLTVEDCAHIVDCRCQSMRRERERGADVVWLIFFRSAAFKDSVSSSCFVVGDTLRCLGVIRAISYQSRKAVPNQFEHPYRAHSGAAPRVNLRVCPYSGGGPPCPVKRGQETSAAETRQNTQETNVAHVDMRLFALHNLVLTSQVASRTDGERERER